MPAKAAPKLVGDPQVVLQDKRLLIKIVVSSSVQPTQEWRLMGKILQMGKKKYTANMSQDKENWIITFEILDTVVKDVGEYRLTCKNDKGQCVKLVKIDKMMIEKCSKGGDVVSEDPPTFEGELMKLEPNEGVTCDWTIRVNGAKQGLTVNWTKGTTKIRSSAKRKVTFVQGLAKCLFMDPMSEDSGLYTCEVHNKFGEASSVGVLDVQVAREVRGKVKQKTLTKAEQETVNLKGFKTDKDEPEPTKKEIPEPKKREEVVIPEKTKRETKAPAPPVPEIIAPADDGAPKKVEKRRGSRIPSDEEEDVSKMFKVKPTNQVVKEGETMTMEVVVKDKPPFCYFYRGTKKLTKEPRITITYDVNTGAASLVVVKCKTQDEGKYKIELCDKDGAQLDFAGFSVFVKDPKDSGLDFRDLLQHKDRKKKGKQKEDMDINLKHLDKPPEEKRRGSAINMPKLGSLQKRGGKPGKPVEEFISPLEDIQCAEKEPEIVFDCKFSKPKPAKLRWYKNRLEIFKGKKYTFVSADDGVLSLTVRNVGMEDAGRYTCEANGKVCNAYLEVEEKKINYCFQLKLPKTLKTHRKKDITFECMLSDPTPPVIWTRDGEPIEYEPNRYEISRRETRCILKVRNVADDDQCEWGCHVEGDSTTAMLVVEEPEYEFTKELTDRDALEKETAEFTCEVNDADAKVTWYREQAGKEEKIDINNPKYFTIIDGVRRCLSVTLCNSKDEGKYTCKVQDKSTTAKLYIAPDVVIKEPLKDLKQVEFETAIFTCKVKNPNKATVKWFKDDVEITIDGKRFIEKTDGDFLTLEVIGLTLEDAGQYKCTIGERETHCKLKVGKAEVKPTIDKDKIPRELTVRAGQPVEIDIPYEGTPLPRMTWTKDGSPVDTNCEQVPTMCKFKLVPAKRSDRGEYVLELENPTGKDTVPITLHVIDVPGPPEPPLDVTDVFRDRCRLSWNPPKDDGGLPIEYYRVELLEVGTDEWKGIGKVKGDTQIGVPGLTPKKKYKFRVKAVNAEGQGPPLENDHEILAKDPFDPPGPPSKPFIVDYDKDQVELRWEPPKSDGGSPLTKYVVEKKLRFGGEWEKVGGVPADQLSAVVPDLEEGQEYEFRVTAYNDAGPGTAGDPTDALKTKARRVKPRIDRNSFEENNNLKAGQSIILSVKFIGEPPPKVKWTVAGNPIEADDKTITIDFKEVVASENVSMLNAQYESTLTYKKAKKKKVPTATLR